MVPLSVVRFSCDRKKKRLCLTDSGRSLEDSVVHEHPAGSSEGRVQSDGGTGGPVVYGHGVLQGEAGAHSPRDILPQP